jgi:hypothetical protein
MRDLARRGAHLRVLRARDVHQALRRGVHDVQQLHVAKPTEQGSVVVVAGIAKMSRVNVCVKKRGQYKVFWALPKIIISVLVPRAPS